MWDPDQAGRVCVTSWEQQITDRHERGMMNVKLQWYPVKDGQVDLPLGAQIIDVRFEDTLGMGGGEEPAAVLVQVNEMPSE